MPVSSPSPCRRSPLATLPCWLLRGGRCTRPSRCSASSRACAPAPPPGGSRRWFFQPARLLRELSRGVGEVRNATRGGFPSVPDFLEADGFGLFELELGGRIDVHRRHREVAFRARSVEWLRTTVRCRPRGDGTRVESKRYGRPNVSMLERWVADAVSSLATHSYEEDTQELRLHVARGSTCSSATVNVFDAQSCFPCRGVSQEAEGSSWISVQHMESVIRDRAIARLMRWQGCAPHRCRTGSATLAGSDETSA